MTVTLPRRTATHTLKRLGLAGCAVFGVAGTTIAFVGVTSAQAAPTPISLTQTWIQDLNDAPCGVAMASPVEATLDSGGPAVEIGDRSGQIYAFHIATPLPSGIPTPVTGWASAPMQEPVGSGQGCGISGNDNANQAEGVNGITVAGNPPIDSTASTMATGNGGSTNTLYFDAGNAAAPGDGGYYAYNANGSLLWNQVVTNPPTDPLPDIGVEASPSTGEAGGVPFINAGALGQETYALNASTGANMPGWPQFTADSVFSTAAVGDLYGTGQDELVVGGASTAGFAYGIHYSSGGHVRIFNDHGGLICQANTTEEVDSSPAVGPILPGGATGIAVGTGSYFGGSDEDTVKVFDSQCNQIWSDKLDGTTGGSPALADVLGNGQLAVVEGTSAGTVWALNAATGATLWSTSLPGEIIGSVTTADLVGNGTQDVIAATTSGLFILDGATGTEVADVDDGDKASDTAAGVCATTCAFGFQNAPLVTADPSGSIGITVAGYFAVNPMSGVSNGDVQGMIQHFTVNRSNGALADQAGGWPQFHHDASLSGFASTPTNDLAACTRPPAADDGYLSVASDGGVFAFGQPFCGSTGAITLNKPVVGMAEAPDQGGYWLVASDGGIFSFGDAAFRGDASALHLNAPIVSITPDPTSGGYWLVGSDGGVFSFGAPFFGSTGNIKLNQPVVSMQSTDDGQGYWFVASDGGIFAYGDAPFFGSTGSLHLNKPVVGMVGY